jgi:bifunctional DNA-binding transcriptional regulator/antitoxin component of YhaV-PrlF toxin-antitoxin module
MENFTEIIGDTTIYKNKITILAEIRERFKLKDGDKLFWIITNNGDLAIRKNPNLKLHKERRFITYTSKKKD